MNMTPEDIAEQRHHRDIVKLLTDLSLGCNSPNAVPAPTLLPEGQKSPMVSIASLLATSPPAAEIPNGSAAAMEQKFHAARQKVTVSRTSGSRPRPRAIIMTIMQRGSAKTRGLTGKCTHPCVSSRRPHLMGSRVF